MDILKLPLPNGTEVIIGSPNQAGKTRWSKQRTDAGYLYDFGNDQTFEATDQFTINVIDAQLQNYINRCQSVALGRPAELTIDTTFPQWLRRHEGKQTVAGMAANMVASDVNFPQHQGTWQEYTEYLKRSGADYYIMNCLRTAFRSYQQSMMRPRLKAGLQV